MTFRFEISQDLTNITLVRNAERQYLKMPFITEIVFTLLIYSGPSLNRTRLNRIIA